MKKLTKREKILLYILTCLVIFSVGIYFFILPSVEEITDLEQQLKNARSIQDETKTMLQTSEQIKERIDSLSVEITDLSSDLFGLMHNFQIDKTITDLLTKNNIRQSNLTVTVPNETDSSSVQIRYVNVELKGNLSDMIKLIDNIYELESVRINAFSIDFSEEDIINASLSLEVFMYATDKSVE